MQWVKGSLNLTGGLIPSSLPGRPCCAVRAGRGLGGSLQHCGMPETERKCRAAPCCAAGHTVLDFYTDSRIKLIYKHNLCTLATRVNSLTGVKYRDDPALFSWDLINEPRWVETYRGTPCSTSDPGACLQRFSACSRIPVTVLAAGMLRRPTRCHSSSASVPAHLPRLLSAAQVSSLPGAQPRRCADCLGGRDERLYELLGWKPHGACGVRGILFGFAAAGKPV